MRKLFSATLLFIYAICASQIAPRPVPAKLYNNLSKEFPDFLHPAQAEKIEQELQAFSNQTSNQICVVIVDDLNGYEAADYATKIINEWGIGQKDLNNGVVILIKPTGGAGGRDLFIAIGYGLEGAIPDLATKRIREEEMYPYLKKGDNYSAIKNACQKLMQLAKNEIDVKDYTKQNNAETWVQNHPLLFFIIIILIFMLLKAIFGGGKGGGGYTYNHTGRHYYGGGWGGGFSSSGGGTGFGGFGGGSSGGGGSGGKW